jgi:hypothetical protein
LSRSGGGHGVTAARTQAKKTGKGQQKQRSKEEFHICLPGKLQSLGGNVCLPGLQPLNHILALIGAEGIPALDCLPSNDMALKRNKMSAGVKQQ